MGDLVDAYRHAKKKHKAGHVSLVCLDDDSLDPTEYGAHGGNTIVPRARDEGGIEGLMKGDAKYGKDGVKRRRIEPGATGELVVIEEQDNFRPDQAAQELDIFAAEDTYAPDPQLQKRAQDELMDIALGNMHTQQPPVGTPSNNGQSGGPTWEQMMQFMQMAQGIGTGQAPGIPQPRTAPEPEPPKKQPLKSVIFSGNFGKFTVGYTAVQIENDFIVFVSSPDQPSTYEPPLSSSVPLTATIDGKEFKVMHLGLSFTYKEDILVLMPYAINPDDDNAQETQ